MLFELILNTLLLDGPITTQTLIRNAGTSAYARHDEFAGKDQSSTCMLAVELEPDAGYDTPASKTNHHWRDINLGISLPTNVRTAEGSMELWQGQCRPQ